MSVERNVPLGPLTTFGIGGLARRFARCTTPEDLREALAEARRLSLPTFVLGGGSNVLVADRGFAGMVLQMEGDALEVIEDGEQPLVRVAAGAGWDDFVFWAVEQELAGVECLSGIPGRVGAAPIQNIGAYGQEAVESIEAVHVLDRGDGTASVLPVGLCGLGYRDSRFKGEWRERYVVTAVDFRLRRGGRPTVRYADLSRALGVAIGEDAPSLAALRQAVLDVRAAKSMLAAPDDPNRRNAGSFFTNPVLPSARLAEIEARARVWLGDEGLHMPRYAAGPGLTKLSAAWLIEHAGFLRGHRQGPVGLSSAHTLCLVNHGEATAHDVIALALRIRDHVLHAFDVRLVPEPVFLGFGPSELRDLLPPT